ncbi:MAG: bifunctional serine/threonine-protein kinase/formylglycine-generating enzyme family protein [Planctomycetota bacterium]
MVDARAGGHAAPDLEHGRCNLDWTHARTFPSPRARVGTGSTTGQATTVSERTTSLFLRASALEPHLRAAFLDSECGDDAELRHEIDALLAQDASARRWMPDSEPGRALRPLLELKGPLGEEILPRRIGKYPILGLIGRGGMGLVYRSEQEHPHRLVALKLLRPDFLSPAGRRRFQYEVEILGRLRHPGIAQIYDAGTFESELGPMPWFAMELIEGLPLLEHARALRMEEKLALLASVADAVQHAHAQGVVHRDLKPSNILVDARGQPKVLDFGVARAIDADLQATTLLTSPGELVGTLAFMSPEQLGGDPREIDARSDVYALGVNSYLLLAGRLPIDPGERSLAASATYLREAEPAPLGRDDPRLAGELDTIVRRALAKEKERRYSTAAELALDLRRYLRHEPILARRASALYVARKFARRNRALTAALAVALLALCVGLASALLLYQREKTQAARALSLSTLERLAALRARSTELWPHRPFDLAAMDAWLRDSEALPPELPKIGGYLAQLRKEGAPAGEGRWAFGDEATRWLHDSLVRVEAELAAFVDPDPHRGLLSEVRARRDAGLGLATAASGAHGEEWRAFAAAFPRTPRYAGSVLEPQPGLVPLRIDPRSGLWEFWHEASGARPELDPATDRWRIGSETGIVLVLVPGGTFLMGAQSEDAGRPDYDANSRGDTEPVREVTLQWFFLSKYELTRAQWRRLTGENAASDAMDGRLPAAMLSWDDCSRMGKPWFLGTPTEAEWEYAARAGTQSAWPFGDENAELARFGNTCDQSHLALDPNLACEAWNDGFASLAPVGSFEPNPFGFHDCFGNVWEWCEDGYTSYEIAPQAPDGFRIDPDPSRHQSRKVLRGGSFGSNSADATPSARRSEAPDARRQSVGVRPSRIVGMLR